MVLHNTFEANAGKCLRMGVMAFMIAATTPMVAMAQQSGDQLALAPHAQQQTSTSILTQEQRARLIAEAKAFDYAMANPGKMGISVLRGADSGRKSEQQMVNMVVRGANSGFKLNAEGFSADNGNKATEITYHYRIDGPGEQPMVVSNGPHNIGDALKALPLAAIGTKSYHGQRQRVRVQ